MVIMAVVVIMMMINLVVLKIRLISGTKLENDGERIASYNQVFPDIKRFFSFSTILTILLQQWPGYLEANERTWWLLKRPMKIRDPRFVSRQDVLTLFYPALFGPFNTRGGVENGLTIKLQIRRF